MNRSILMGLLLLVDFAFNNSIADVTVTVKQYQHEFTHEPRLVEVLASIVNSKTWYWPAAALYQADDIQLDKTRQLLLSQISSMAKRFKTKKPELARSLEQLQTTINGWHLARRLHVKIDYDLPRIVAEKNPLLTHGKYILDLSRRQNTVQLFGAINGTTNVNHRGHADVSEYIDDQTLTDLADKDIVILIQADGRKIKAPVAYWNKTHQEVMPGSQLFIPFKPSLFHPEFASINKRIVTLALNRVQ
jgi:hypothetical protein